MAKCAVCNDQEKRSEDDARLAFQVTPAVLRHSAYINGCESCLVILEGFRQGGQTLYQKDFQLLARTITARCRGQQHGRDETLSLEVYFYDDRPKLELEFYSIQPHAWKSILPRTASNGHPLSDRALAWVQSRLDNCQQFHDSCRGPYRIYLPKRVLEIQEDDSCRLTIRLVETTAYAQGIYVALSHCWGNDQPLKTTKETLQDMKRGIPWDTLPRTFQDAIDLTFLLGLKFIWIDSLCIIQDDKHDWEEESVKMADVYQFASITLSATASFGDVHGCFPAPFSTSSSLPISLPEDVGTCEIAVRKPLVHWNTAGQDELHQRFPLMTRGWAFQERILSRRVLHLCEAELVWECREQSICECGGLDEQEGPVGFFDQGIKASEDEWQNIAAHRIRVQEDLKIRQYQEEEIDRKWSFVMPGLRRASAKSIRRWFVKKGKLQPTLPPHLDPKTDVSERAECTDSVLQFHRIVEQYSRRKLTNQTDRLPALSGLCKRIQHIRGEYAAGLWHESLCFDLLWRVARLNADDLIVAQPSTITEYYGPSWSWVSVHEPVLYWSDIINFHDASRLFEPPLSSQRDMQQYKPFSKPTCLGRNLKDECVSLQLVGKNTFGEVANAILTGEASTTTATLRYVYSSFWHDGTNTLDSSRYRLTLGADDIVELPFWADYPLAIEGPGHIPNGYELTLFLIHPRVCLVLADTGFWSHDIPQYRRVGITRIRDDTVNNYKIDWMEFSDVKTLAIV